MDTGWIKLHRKLKDSPVFADSTLLHVWIMCLLEAAHAEHVTLIGRREVSLQPGEFVTGRHRAGQTTGLTDQRVRSALKALESMRMIKRKSTNKGTIVKILNWDKYQLTSKSTSKQPAQYKEKVKDTTIAPEQLTSRLTSNQPAPNQQVTTTEEYKEELRKRKKERVCGKSEPEKPLTPNPANYAGGVDRFEKSFSPEYETVLAIWKSVCQSTRARAYVLDAGTREGATILASALASQEFTEKQLRAAMRKMVQDDKCQTWGLRGFANNCSTFLRPEVRTAKPAALQQLDEIDGSKRATPEEIRAVTESVKKRLGSAQSENAHKSPASDSVLSDSS